jgi:hypothetical protein
MIAGAAGETGETMAQNWKSTGLALLAGGVAGVFLAPVVTPAVARAARPTAKALLKLGMAVYQRGLETAAGLREAVEDATAEIQAEAASAAPPSPPEDSEMAPRRAVH